MDFNISVFVLLRQRYTKSVSSTYVTTQVAQVFKFASYLKMTKNFYRMMIEE
jgi:hypothetical protein